MKSRKFLISSAIALSTMLGTAAPMMNAMPISATTVTVSNFAEGHAFTAYQIFTGKLEDDKLVDIEWGTSADTTAQAAIIAALKGKDSPLSADKITALGDNPNAAAVANAIDGLDAEHSLALAKLLHPILTENGKAITSDTTDLTPGYYLIKDTTTVDSSADDVIGLSILQVANTEVVITPKNAKPTVDKEVSDNDNHDESNEAGWGETADHEIGDTFQFRLTAAIAQYADIKNYDSYKLVFHDTLSAGIDYVSEGNLNAEMFVGDNTTAIEVPTTTAKDGQNLTVTIDNLKAHLPAEIQENDAISVVVTYNAKLNAQAVVAESGVSGLYNNNKVYLEYSNNPNGEGTGQTKEDYVHVFTYKLTNTKTDNMGNTLQGAEFVLKKGDQFAAFTNGIFSGWSTAQDDTTKLTSGEDGTFVLTGLDAGTYTLVETKAPEGYKLAADTTITITASHKEDDGGASATVTLSGENHEGATVVDSKISNLPETGGMGTTLFYAAGGILAAGAVIALAAGKKAKKEED